MALADSFAQGFEKKVLMTIIKFRRTKTARIGEVDNHKLECEQTTLK